MGIARAYRVGHGYAGAELAEIDVEQTADVMYLAHIDHPLGKLQRFGHTNWLFGDVAVGPSVAAPAGITVTATTPNTDSENDGAAFFSQPASYVVTAVSDLTGQESRASPQGSATNDLTLKRNFNTITWPAVTGADRYRVYKAENTQSLGWIGDTTELTFRDDNIGPALDEGPPAADNPFATPGDYPSTVALFEQRLILARTKNNPNAIYGSKSADLENFDVSRPLRDNDALAVRAVATQVNAINQLVSGSDLLALTSNSIFKVDGAGEGGYLTATQARARRQVGRGSSRLSPLLIDNVAFYRPSAGSAIRTLGYSFELDGYQSNDMTIFSHHLFKGLDIVSWAYAQEPDSLIWAARSDGKLLCFTWEQEQQVWGWTLCETDGLVESVCCIPEAGEDRLYLTVRRVVGGVSRLFIERMASSLWSDAAQACYLDCAISYQVEEPATVFGRLDHLEGRTVAALVDGAVVRDLTVTNGRVELPPSAGAGSNVTIGLPYAVTIETLPLILQNGNNVGRAQQAGDVTVSLIDSGDVLVGPTEAKLHRLKSRLAEAYGDATELLTGDYSASTERHVSGKVSLIVRQDAPLPLTLTGAFIEPHVGG